MDPQAQPSTHVAWSHLRFSVIGALLSAPPAPGELKAALIELSNKTWQHPVTGEPVQFAKSTLEQWYYQAKRAKQDPVGTLRRQVRKDVGQQRVINQKLAQALIEQYRRYRHWSVKLHHDNLLAQVKEDPSLGSVPSYPSIRRFMRARGLDKQPRRRDPLRPGVATADARLERREVRSFEAEHVNAVWHLDFHASSLKVLTDQGQWVHPRLLGVLDDHSRLACHVQWYWHETAQDLVHGLCQAFCKRGLPRRLLTDNGAAMMAAEVRQGLTRLGIVHNTTLPYSPYQNGKQEVFWANVEGRLMAMLTRVQELTLDLLNEATQAWVEIEYHRTKHSQTTQTPLDRFLNSPQVGRPAPCTEDLRQAFRQDLTRTQRRSDGTITIDGVRFELPNRFGHCRQVTVRCARWNLRDVHLVDPKTDAILAPIYPLDKARNADGRRRVLAADHQPQIESSHEPTEQLAPLLRKLIADYAATGIPPAYIPKDIHEAKL